MARPNTVLGIILKHKTTTSGKVFFTWVMQTSQDPKISIVSHRYANEKSCQRSLEGWAEKLNFQITKMVFGSTYDSEYRHPELLEY